MKTVLLAGFEPFAGATLNPSWEARRQHDGETLDGARRLVAVLPPWRFGAVHGIRLALQTANHTAHHLRHSGGTTR